MCGAAGSPRTGLRRVGRGGQDPSELASRCAAATGLSCRASRCMSGSASVPAAQLPTAASRCATLQALHTPVHQMWGGAARTPARASTVVDNTCPQKGKLLAPPPPAVRAGGAGGLVLPEETAAHASETLAYSGICVRNVITRLGRRLRRRALLWRISSACFCPAVPRGAAQQFRSRSSSRAHGQVQ